MSMKPPRNARPHRLELYEQAVQQPLAEVGFLERLHAHYNPGSAAALLREDFAGSASVSAAWCMSHPDRQALAVDNHEPTLRWAQRRHAAELDDLHLVEADVMSFDRPRVDVVASLNFSTFIYHTPADLLAYFRHARRCLRPGGVFCMDAYGGPGAQTLGTQTRPAYGFTYHWEQRAFNPVTHRTDCRIHFTLPDGREMKSAFRYDWRLWTLPELTAAMAKAGFSDVAVWAKTKTGRFRPTAKMPAEENWVVYVAGLR